VESDIQYLAPAVWDEPLPVLEGNQPDKRNDLGYGEDDTPVQNMSKATYLELASKTRLRDEEWLTSPASHVCVNSNFAQTLLWLSTMS